MSEKGKTVLPADFSITDEMKRWAWSNCKGLNIEACTAEFVDYAKARDWRMKDWQATWRNWLRKASKADAGKKPQSSPMTHAPRAALPEPDPLPNLSEGRLLATGWFCGRLAKYGAFNAGKAAIDKLREHAYHLADQFDLLRAENDPEATRERLYVHLDKMLERWQTWRSAQ